MKSLLILGAGGHGKVCADAAIKMGAWKEIAFIDDNKCGDLVMGLNIVGKSDDLMRLLPDFKDAFVAIGNNEIRLARMSELKRIGYNLATIIHPSAVVGIGVQIGEGSILMAGAIVNSTTKIGIGCIINTGATVDHDCDLNDGVHISPGAHVAGDVSIGEKTWIGIGASICNRLKICDGCMVGASAAVIDDITGHGTYIGVPARKMMSADINNTTFIKESVV